MNSKKVWSLLLLVAMSFSIVHEYAFSMLDDDHCSVQEYVSELSAPSDHGDICDSHFEYHTAYILPFKRAHHSDISTENPYPNLDETYLSRNWFELFKPPTA